MTISVAADRTASSTDTAYHSDLSSTIPAGGTAGPSLGRPVRTATYPAAGMTAQPVTPPRAPTPGVCPTAVSAASSATPSAGPAPGIATGLATEESLRPFLEHRLSIDRAVEEPVH